MECSQNDVVNDFAELTKSGSELDINLDDVINRKEGDSKNEPDILSNLITAIEESLSGLSVNTAMTAETIEQNLNAYADPPLHTRISFSTASELSDTEEIKTNEQFPDDPFYPNLQPSPLQVWRNENGITEFQMMFDENKVTVVDSLECLNRLQHDPPLEPVFFDPRVYLGVPCNPDEEVFGPIESMSDVSTAELGPTSQEFEDWVREIEENK